MHLYTVGMKMIDIIRALKRCIRIGIGWKGGIILSPVRGEVACWADGAAPVKTAAAVTAGSAVGMGALNLLKAAIENFSTTAEIGYDF